MQYKFFFLFLILASCVQNISHYENKIPYNSKGFAYIYNNDDYLNKIIKEKLNNNSLEIAHSKLRPGSLIKLINPENNNYVILKNTKRFQYPEFYKILITKPVADKLRLNNQLPLIELMEIKKNKSFIAKKTKIFVEEKKIHSKAPVETVKIDNISINKLINAKTNKKNIFIIIAEL